MIITDFRVLVYCGANGLNNGKKKYIQTWHKLKKKIVSQKAAIVISNF